MASTIQIKRGTGSAVPSGLADGELAINLDNGKLYFGSGSTSVNNFTFGELTAEKYIVSSSVLYITTSFSSGSTEFGNSADDTHTFTGNITASSNISASGDLMATDLTLGGTSRISSTVGTIQINDHLYVTSGQHITASGNISSSGNITSNTLTVDGLSNQGSEATAVMIDGSNIVGTRELGSNAFTSTTIGTTTNTLTVDDATLQLNSGTTFNGSAARTISVKDGGIDSDALAQNLILVDGGSNVIVQGSSETGFKIFSTHAATTRDVGLTLSASSNGQQYTLGLNRTNDSFVIAPSNVGTAPENAVFELDTTGNITASGDISSSGNIYANRFGNNLEIIDTNALTTIAVDSAAGVGNSGLKINVDGVDKLDFQKDALPIKFNVHTLFDAPITASGNISSSGTISGQAGLLVHSKSNSTDGNAQGDVLYFGGGSGLTVGSVCHYNSSGNWELADADDNTKSDGLLGVALATAPSGGILLRGMVTLDHDPGAVGDALYLTTTAGDVSATAPSGNGNIVRIVGYCLDASNGQIWFNPDSTFVEVNA